MNHNSIKVGYSVQQHYCIRNHQSITLLQLVRSRNGQYMWTVHPYHHEATTYRKMVAKAKKDPALKGLQHILSYKRYQILEEHHITQLRDRGVDPKIISKLKEDIKCRTKRKERKQSRKKRENS